MSSLRSSSLILRSISQRATPISYKILTHNALLPSRSSYTTTANHNNSNDQNHNSSSPPPKSSSKLPVFAALGIGGIGLAYYVLTADDSKSEIQERYKTPKSPNQNLDYQSIYNEISNLLDDSNYDDGSFGPVFIRLAWHSSGTYDKESNTGGSNGATMRFAPESDHGANAGLAAARDRLESIYKKYESKGLTYSDLWTLAGVAAVQELGGPKVPWRPGRQDGVGPENCTPDGRLPDGDKDQDHIRKIFYRMGFNDQEIVALSGAHALGRCHPDRSGFSGPWTFSPTSFSNEYYKLLLNEKWQPKKWSGPPQYEDKKSKSLMMLTTDMSLLMDKSFRNWTKKYAADESLFFQDFSKAFSKLLELGVPLENFGSQAPLTLKTLDDQGL
ncbi:hypothetical protein O181_067577 [Austropuccinia psidii MF-1]|uniref:Peroxidase n=1 Tax=Austropuccinia psidii MF-1 TaxID=1389203 RepID=A0A9Q3I5E7_9BASI|nr:hypothetical protein [Austropuccinia psidii MF-1]